MTSTNPRTGERLERNPGLAAGRFHLRSRDAGEAHVRDGAPGPAWISVAASASPDASPATIPTVTGAACRRRRAYVLARRYRTMPRPGTARIAGVPAPASLPRQPRLRLARRRATGPRDRASCTRGGPAAMSCGGEAAPAQAPRCWCRAAWRDSPAAVTNGGTSCSTIGARRRASRARRRGRTDARRRTRPARPSRRSCTWPAICALFENVV